MSAVRIATSAPSLPPSVAARAAEQPKLSTQVLTALGALTKWLPAEIVAGYAAVVTAMQPESGQPPNISWAAWVIALAATPALVVLAALVAKKTEKLAWKATLSVPAFALWSASIPHSVWEKWHAFKENRPLFLFGLLIVVSIFTGIAQLIVGDE